MPMKAVRLTQIANPLEDAEVPLPEIGPSEVLVRVAACGIGHSDAQYRAGTSPIDPLPVTLGPDVAGRGASVGREVYVVDINRAKLASVAAFGGIAIDATAGDPVEQIREATDGKGVDVSIELVGSAITMGQAVRCLGVFGRAALVGLTAETMSVLPYPEVIKKEVEIIGVSDHLASELPLLIQFACNGHLCFPDGTLRSVDLDAAQINAALDEVEKSTDHIRTVIVPRPTT